ncbi:MAG: dolichol-phosphate mannosyltransferase [Candidatus Nitrosomirales archaeon]|jgi:dolichol-phosphate mannosyltransferase
MLEEKVASSLEFDKSITIVIPTLNEEQGVAKVLEELHYLRLRNILVVDGYSSDRTVDIAKQFGARVIYQHGKGKTGAIKTAIQEISTPYLLVMDGDFTYDASCISRLLHQTGSHDEVIGTRISTADSMSRLHKFGNKVISKIFNILMNTNVSDVCSGMYLLRTSSAKDLHLETDGFDVEAEIAAQIAASGSIGEVPVIYRKRVGRQKLSTWKHGFRIIRTVFDLARSYNPGVFYSMVGGFLIIPASVMLFNSLIDWMFTGKIFSSWFFAGISTMLVAVQSLSVGVLSLIMRRTELRIARRLKKLTPQGVST